MPYSSLNLYWLYDLPHWLFGVVTISFFVIFGLAGLSLTRAWVKKLHRVDHSHNDIVSYFFAGVTVFYGVTLGLVAIGTWNTYTAAQDRVDAEAQVIAALYRDVGAYSDPWKSELRQDLRNYVHHVITVSWPQQHMGVVPRGSGVYLDDFQTHLMSYQPTTMYQEINQAEIFRQYNVLIEARRSRLNSITAGLPGALWMLVIFGGLISIVVSLFFDTASFSMHAWMTSLLSLLLGLIIFLVATLDHPFRSQVSVSASPLELVQHMMSRSSDIDKR